MKKEETKRINVVLSEDTYKIIEKMAMKENVSKSEIVRNWIGQGLAGTINKESIDLTSKIIKEEIKAVLDPAMERLIAFQVKTFLHAATGGFLTAETIARLLPDELQEDYQEVYNRARKKANQSLKIKEDSIEFEE